MTESPQPDLHRQVADVLERLRPLLVMEGAAVDLIDVEDGEVMIHVTGDPASKLVVKRAVERALTESFEQVERVVLV